MQLKRVVNKKTLIGEHVYDLNNKEGVITEAASSNFTVKFKDNTIKKYHYTDIVNDVISFSDEAFEDAILFKYRKQKMNLVDSPIVNDRILKSNVITTEERSLILEQWKTAVESAAEVSNRRHLVNSFFMAIMTILTSGIIFSDMFMTLHPTTRITIALVDGVLGVAICHEWKAQLRYYSDLCDVKYQAIRDMEKYLPFFVFNFEDIYFYNRYNDEKSFSKKESRIPTIFIVALLLIVLTILLTSILGSCETRSTSGRS